MIASLLAMRIFLLILVNIIVGFKPAIPGIAEIVISIFFNILLNIFQYCLKLQSLLFLDIFF